MKRISLLEKELKEASQKYYTDGTSPLSDKEFDSKLEELKKVKPESTIIDSVGHGFVLESSNNKRKHIYGLVGSLSKVHNFKELDSSLSDKPVICSLKLDGISSVFYYLEGKLQYVLTRGSGIEGIDITDKCNIIAPDMINIPGNFTGAIRGELLMRYSRFEEYKKIHKEAKNPRNTTAGLINKKKTDTKDLIYLDLVIYTMMASNLDYIDSYISILNYLESVHEVVPYEQAQLTSNNLDKIMSELESKWSDSYDYPSDGIVITDNLLDIDNNIDVCQIRYNSQAYKFLSESRTSEVIGVDWNLGKSGNIIPRVNFNTIKLAGTDVSYATGFNAKFIKDNKIGRDSLIEVTKSGEIIPYIKKVIHESPIDYFNLPTYCPECNEQLIWNGVHLCCNNPRCKGMLRWNTTIWISTLSPMDGISDTIIHSYLDRLEITTVSDLYEDGRVEYIPNEKSKRDNLFKQVLDNMYNNKVSLKTAIMACNIPRLGESNSSKLERFYDSIISLLDKPDISVSDLTCLNSIGDANFRSLCDNIDRFKNIKYIKNNIIKPIEINNVRSIGDVCITGKLSVKRSEFEKTLRLAGYNSVKSVKKDTLFLITNDPNSGSSKNKQADKYGIRKMSEHDFRTMIKDM